MSGEDGIAHDGKGDGGGVNEALTSFEDTQVRNGDDQDIPDTLRFVTEGHAGERARGMHVVVFGGSSGIGFATAAMAIQECADRVLLVAQNEQQLLAAQKVLQEVGQNRDHCDNANAKIDISRANIWKREQVAETLQAAAAREPVHAVINTAGIAGYIGVSLGDIPDDVFNSKFDPVLNNLYGSMYISAEALRMWKLTGDESGPGFIPRLVHLSSEEALMPCPGCDLYGISKSGIVSMTRSLAAFYEGQLSANVVAPGLVNTPLTWNQVRGSKLTKNGTELEQIDAMQTYQCYAHDTKEKTIIEDGTCPDGGTGLGCPCEDVKSTDPRLPLKYGSHLWPPIDPRDLGDMILHLLTPDYTSISGNTFVVDNNVTHSSSTWASGGFRGSVPSNEFRTMHLVKSCPMSMVELCPSAIKFTPSPLVGIASDMITGGVLSHILVLFIGLLLGRFFMTPKPRPEPVEQGYRKL